MTKTEKTTLVVLDLAFLSVAGVAAYMGRLPEIPAGLFWVLLGFAAFRAGRSVSDNLIFKWLRDLLGVIESADSSGAGNSNEPGKEPGVTRILSELVCCPICSGTWAAVTLLLAYAVIPAYGRALIYALGAAGLAELINWMSEYFSWGGRASREVAGSYWLEKNRPGAPALFSNYHQEVIGKGNGRDSHAGERV